MFSQQIRLVRTSVNSFGGDDTRQIMSNQATSNDNQQQNSAKHDLDSYLDFCFIQDLKKIVDALNKDCNVKAENYDHPDHHEDHDHLQPDRK